MSEPDAEAEVQVHAQAHADFERPPEVVRAAFLDVDHAIRARIHHGLETRWLPPSHVGELRYEQTSSVLGRPQVDVLVLEEQGGKVVRRFVGGPNRGSRIELTFAPLEGGVRARVDATAFAPLQGFRTRLGKLSALGVEKLLQKLLAEHERSLEGYTPGRAHGAIAAVLAPLRETVATARSRFGESKVEDKRALMTNLLEAACTVAVADGHADEAEREVIREVARTLSFVDLDASAIDRMVSNVAAAIASDGVERRCHKIAARLQVMGLGRVGLAVAALVADISHGIGVEEHATLECLARELSVTPQELEDLVRHTDVTLAR